MRAPLPPVPMVSPTKDKMLLVILPHEPHWYEAMESNEQLVYEMLRWFDKYVKDAPPQ